MYLLTRPVPSLTASQQAFAQAGLSATVLGLVDIAPVAAAINDCVAHLTSTPAPIVIVTSQFAVAAISPLLAHLPADATVLAVGQTTASHLQQLGITCQAPALATSEGLLALPQLTGAKNKQVVIIKGEGGRTTLASSLQQQGAQVQTFAVYRRQPCPRVIQSNQWQWPDVKGIIATSEEMARLLFRHYPAAELHQHRWLTVSPRVAATLQELGLTRISHAAGASDRQLCQWIKDNWE